MIKIIIAFVRGIYEFRRSWTWADPERDEHHFYTSLDEAYDKGRELAHKVTLLRFEN